MRSRLDLRNRTGAYRAIASLCVLLIFLTGLVAVVHFHADQTSDHACSVCALAHAGIAPTQLGPQVPVFVPSSIAETSAAQPGSLLLVSSDFIRPPPAV
jgi:hypothetical protein